MQLVLVLIEIFDILRRYKLLHSQVLIKQSFVLFNLCSTAYEFLHISYVSKCIAGLDNSSKLVQKVIIQ